MLWGKKSVFFYSFLIFTPVIFAACTIPFFGGGQQPVTIRYWGLWEPATVMDAVFAKYKLEHPNVTIEYEQQDPRDYRERLQAAIAAGTGPDIFRFHNTWVPIVKNELAQIPPAVIDATTFQNNFYSVAQRDLAGPEGFWGIPLEFDGLGLYYNVDLLEAAGFTQPPTNWDQLRTAAATLTVKDTAGKIITAGVALGTADNIDHFSDILAVMMAQNGVDLKNIITGDEKRDKLAIDAMDFYTVFAKSGQDRTWDDTQESTTAAFAAGKLAFYLAPSWRAFEVKLANPELNFKITPIPQLPGGKVNWASYWVEGVSAKSKNQQAAFDLLKFLAQPDTLQTFYSEAAKVRLFGEPYPVVSLGESLAQDPFVGAYIQSAPTAVSFPAVTNTFDNGLNDRISQFFKDAVNSVNSGTNTKTAFITNPLDGIVRLDTIRLTVGNNFQILPVAAGFALFWIVFVANMINWSSGVDGQIPGIVIITAIILALLAGRFASFDPSQIQLIKLALILSGSAAGFLIFHWHPAKIFPGYGVTVWGITIATLAILAGAKVATAILILALPVADGIVSITRRILAGRSPVWADRGHLHHLLLARGLTQPQIALLYWTITGVLGYFALNLSSSAKAFAIVLIIILVTGAVLWLNLILTEKK